MRYLVKDPNGREAVLDLTRGSAVRLLCRWCSEFGNRDPHEPCPVVSCDLHPFQTGSDKDAQHRAVAVKDYCRGWCCLGDSWAADRCDVRTCPLFPFRKGLHRTDRSVEVKEQRELREVPDKKQE